MGDPHQAVPSLVRTIFFIQKKWKNVFFFCLRGRFRLFFEWPPVVTSDVSCLAIDLCTSKVVDCVAVPQVARCHGLCERFCNRVLEVPATWIPSALSERVGAQLFRATRKKVIFLRQKNAVVRNLINDTFLRPKSAEKKSAEIIS